MKHQTPPSPTDITNWVSNADYGGLFPKGARDKSLYTSPTEDEIGNLNFIRPNFSYLFKESFDRYPCQFWAEIVAYRVGCIVGVEVPPAFVSIRKEGSNIVCGALIEWFYDEKSPDFVFYEDGGGLFEMLINDFDTQKGTQHNLKTILNVFYALSQRDNVMMVNKYWVNDWIRMLLFDALIGNTDRHQNNWGVIYSLDQENVRLIKFSPAFDNGTSLGHEIVEKKIKNFLSSSNRVEIYTAKGQHHMKLEITGPRLGHFEFFKKLIDMNLELKAVINHFLDFDYSYIEALVYELLNFNVPVRLSRERADFMLLLIRKRFEKLYCLI